MHVALSINKTYTYEKAKMLVGGWEYEYTEYINTLLV